MNTPNRKVLFSRLFSLRSMLLLMVLAATLPLLILVAETARELRQNEQSLAYQRLEAKLFDVVSQQRLLNESVLMLFRSIAAIPGIESGGKASDDILASLLNQNPFMTTLIFADYEGRILASGTPIQNFQVDDRPYFQRALATGQFSYGPMIISRSTGRPALPYALPLPERRVVLLGSFFLDNYQHALSEHLGGDATTLEIFDSLGYRLYSLPLDHSRPIGQPVDPELYALAKGAPADGVHTMDGELRFAVFQAISPPGQADSVVYIALCQPLAVIVDRFAGLSLRNGLIGLVFAVLSMVMAMLIGHLAIHQRLTALVEAGDRFRMGDFSVRMTVGGHDEIGRLSRAFNAMMASVQERDEGRDRTEAALSEAVAERDALLQEIHHRVKNNFQVVSSLLALQLGELDDPAFQLLLEQSRARIQAMAQVHETLYASDNFAHLDFGFYVRQLADRIADGFNAAPTMLMLEPEGISVDLDRAVPLGLIINEALTNAYKHSRTVARADVRLRVVDTGSALELTISDNGHGFPEDFLPEQSTSLGVRLMTALAGQLRGSISFRTSPDSGGAEVHLVIPGE